MEEVNWKQEAGKIFEYLSTISIRDKNKHEMKIDNGFAYWRQLTVETRERKNVCYFIGNGASASIASHMAADLAKNAHMHTQVFFDLSLITAMANDIGYDQVYAEPLKRRGAKDDMLVAISSSGESKNIINAVKVAEAIGMSIITISARSQDNPLRNLGDLNLFVPAKDYGHAETCHSAVLHYWMDLMTVSKGSSQINHDVSIGGISAGKTGVLS